MDNTLKHLRMSYKITQYQASTATKLPLRTYVRYEKDPLYGSDIKRQAIINLLNETYAISEEKGILSLEKIIGIVQKTIEEYSDEIEFCYLFGSYARSCANEKSDVDLCVSTTLQGFRFVGLMNALSNNLHKKVDLIRLDTLENNIPLIREIMKDGLKVYDKCQRR